MQRSASCCAVHPHVRGDNAARAGTAPEPVPVHPHVRGDNVCCPHRTQGRVGSPPRAWGQPGVQGGVMGERAVHPHVRGDNVSIAVSVGTSVGSPPRAWGQRFVGANLGREGRFTPTCVGTTVPTTVPAFASRFTPTCVGTTHEPRHGSDCVRFTPTCVGTTARLRSWPCRYIGSPPRAWGQLQLFAQEMEKTRFTPTCVGTTVPSGLEPPTGGRFTPTCVGTTPAMGRPGVDALGSPPRAGGQRGWG